jgi:pimeloyl-ACP methyl ester carboxylesterase
MDHGIGAQTNLLLGFLDALGLPSVTLIGHDSGGTFAREAAVARPDRVARIVIADTEVPGHRPALVPTLQKLMRWTKRLVLFGRMTRSKRFARSKPGFGRLFSDVDAIDFDEFFRVTLAPIAASERLQQGTLKFAIDFDFERVDALRDSYKGLTLPKYVLWGEDDAVFPLEQGWRLRDMLPGPTRFDMIPRAGMLVHEERPEAWVSAVRSFLKYPPIS